MPSQKTKKARKAAPRMSGTRTWTEDHGYVTPPQLRPIRMRIDEMMVRIEPT